MKRIPSLDGMRAVSIALVVVGHWAELRFHSNVAGAFANLGVRIFFVISGYLITTLLLRELEKRGSICVRDFYVRRAYRILPAAMVFMAIAFVLFWRELRWYHMAAAVFYVANFDFTHPWYLGHLWSLSVEEQFYLLWPGVLKKWYRHRTKILVGVVAFAPVYRVACHLAGLRGQADETFPAVADVIAVGCLLAMVAKCVPRISGAWVVAMGLIVASVPTYWGLRGFHSDPVLLFVLWPLMHLSIAGLILHVVRMHYSLLNLRAMVWLGQISYSLYLWQQLFVFGTHGRPWYGVIAAVGAASASYYCVEKPILRLRERRARASEAMFAAAA
ncbi:MAG TPA: acyltransferase [Candidatus Eisenbacteria bacterium]|nr:acyltransferase [Candidatus Eisenbacteria bacterium]